MLFTQKMKLSDLESYQQYLLAGQKSSTQLLNLFRDLKIEINLPGVDEESLNLTFSENTLKISRKGRTEAISFASESGSSIVAESAKTKVALGIVERMAKTSDPVVIFGENGTGKTLFARTIHQQSTRSGQPFVSIPCGAVDKSRAEQQFIESLVEVGHGTLLFHDIQDLDMERQRQLQKIIGNPLESVPFRLVTTTSTDLDSAVQKGEFSAELLAILQGCYIELPPLQERKEDIRVLADFYIENICQRSGQSLKVLSPELLRILETYHWPGNVRELVNTIEQLLITAQEKKTLFAKDLPARIRIQTIKSSAAQKKGL